MNNDSANYMTTLSTVMEVLRQRGIEQEFRWTPEGMTIGRGKFYQPTELTIIRVYRFEGLSDPADNAILYVMKADDELVGYCIDTYGAYSNQGRDFSNFVREVPIVTQEDDEMDF